MLINYRAIIRAIPELTLNNTTKEINVIELSFLNQDFIHNYFFQGSDRSLKVQINNLNGFMII